MPAMTVEVGVRIRNRSLALWLVRAAQRLHWPRLAAWAIRRMRVEMRLGTKGRWRLFLRPQVSVEEEAINVDWREV